MRALLLLSVAACAAPLIGCQESGFDEAKETARPLKVQHAAGESKVPGQAERPAALTVDTLDDTLALGVTPVTTVLAQAGIPAYLRGRELEAVTPEALEAADPDVILDHAPDQGDMGLDAYQARVARRFARYSRIAPVVMLDGAGAQWKLNLRLAGEGLGRTNDAEALLSDYDEQVASVRSALSRDARVSGRFADDSFAASILADAGVQLVRRGRADAKLEDPVWAAPGGALAARTALEDLQRILQK